MPRINFECISKNIEELELAKKLGIDYVVFVVEWNWSNLFSEEGRYVEQFITAEIKYNDGRVEKYGKEWSPDMYKKDWRKVVEKHEKDWCEVYLEGSAPEEINKFLNFQTYPVPDNDWEYPTTIEYKIVNEELAKEILKNEENFCIEYDVYDEKLEENSEYIKFYELLKKLKGEYNE